MQVTEGVCSTRPVRTEERHGYMLVVVVERDDLDDWVAYYVTCGPSPGDEEDRFHWRYMTHSEG